MRKVVYLFLLPVLAAGVLNARGGAHPDRLLPEIESISKQRDAEVAALIGRVAALPQEEGVFARRDFVGALPAWFASLDGRGNRRTLRLDDRPRASEVYGISSSPNRIREIGNVRLGLNGYNAVSFRTLLVDVRSPYILLLESYSALKGGMERPRPVTPLEGKVFAGTLTASGPDRAMRAAGFRLFYPKADYMLCGRLPGEACRRKLEAVLAYWEKLEPADGESRRSLSQAVAGAEPPFLTLDRKLLEGTAKKRRKKHPSKAAGTPKDSGGGFSTFHAPKKPARGGFASAGAPSKKGCRRTFRDLDFQIREDDPGNFRRYLDWLETCRNDPSIRVRGWYEDDSQKAVNKWTAPLFLAIRASQTAFRVLGDDNDRYTFETILESMVEKGRAKRTDANESSLWKGALEVLGDRADPKGWAVYADASGGAGAVLYNREKGIGVWQPALFNRLGTLEASTQKINALGAKLFDKVMVYQSLLLKAAGRELKKRQAAGSDIDEAF